MTSRPAVCLWLLDWESWGTAPASYDAAKLVGLAEDGDHPELPIPWIATPAPSSISSLLVRYVHKHP
ncbi:MAG: hypothetical protein ACRDR6_15785 [Pseudonocardiaceae bacterium]